MSDGILTQGKLFPLRDISQHEVANRFALDGTGLNGLFVSYVTGYAGITGSSGPDNADGYSRQAVASSYTNVFSTIYLNNRRVVPATLGQTQWEVAGVTLNTVAINDENGNPLRNMPHYKREERGFILTGQTVPIVKRGFLTINNSQILGATAPLPGYPFIATGAGQIIALTPAQATGQLGGGGCLVLGRFTSATGVLNGGYTELEILL